MTLDATPVVVAYVGLGANLGDAAGTLRAAFARLDALPGTRLTARSRLYRTAAWGVRDQPDFVNAVAELRTTLSAHALLGALLAIEREFGRQRAADGSDRWGPRLLDLDVLLYGDALIDSDGLCVPHPQMHRRGFVMIPLREIAPEATIPGHGRVRTLADALVSDDESRIEVLADA